MKKFRILALSSLCVLAFATSALCATTTSQQAANAVRGWLAFQNAPFGKLAGAFDRVESWGADGPTSTDALYHVAYLKPAGIVILPGDDLLEPISAYAADATAFGADEKDPLKNVLAGGIARAVETLRTSSVAAKGASSRTAERWRILEAGTIARGDDSGDGTTGDDGQETRVQPLVKSAWNQGHVGPDETFYVYNYYTPNHYPSGCSTTATSQVMRYFEHPKTAIGARTFKINVDGIDTTTESLGGDEKGGPYRWDLMPLSPDVTATDEERRAIGALLHDVGASLNSLYEKDGTGAITFEAADRLMDTFGYANAAAIRTGAGIPQDVMLHALNSNLDAGCPTVLSISGFQYAQPHAVVCDGYAYSAGTFYHHVNMGWGGHSTTWYVLPVIELLNDEGELVFTYTTVSGIVYNIFPEEGPGEIVSGRVLDTDGNPVASAAVRISGGAYTGTAQSDKSGIFAFKGVPSNTLFAISASDGSRRFATDTVVKTGKSSRVDKDSETWFDFEHGNVWGVELTEADDVPSGGSGGCSASALICAIPALLLRRRR